MTFHWRAKLFISVTVCIGEIWLETWKLHKDTVAASENGSKRSFWEMKKIKERKCIIETPKGMQPHQYPDFSPLGPILASRELILMKKLIVD